MSNINTISVTYSGTSSFVPSAPSQRQFALDTTNNQYIRNATLTQDALTLNYYTSSVIISLQNLYQIAVGVNSNLGWPPVIITQPTSSTVTHPTSSIFLASASAANNSNVNYQWFSSSYSQSLVGSGSFPLTSSNYSYSGTSGSLLTLLTSSLSDNASTYYCLINCISGNTTSNIATLTVL
jgi:hypothetical protein